MKTESKLSLGLVSSYNPVTDKPFSVLKAELDLAVIFFSRFTGLISRTIKMYFAEEASKVN